MAKRKGKQLTTPEKSVLKTLAKYQEQAGYPPTVREIVDLANITSTSMASYYLDSLTKKGYIERDDRVARGIRIIQPDDKHLTPAPAAHSAGSLVSVPIAGTIAAGEPIIFPASDFPAYDRESSVELPAWMIPPRTPLNELFALKVKGDSMIDALVNEGDIVILRKTETAQNGDMIAAWLPDEESSTLKYFFRETGGARLQPANPNYACLHLSSPGSLEVKGKVVLVIRQMDR